MNKSTVVLSLSLLLGTLLPTRASAQEWPYTRQNPARTGFASGAGEIDVPAVRSRAYLGGTLTSNSVYIRDVNNDGRVEAAVVVSGKVLLKDMQDRVLWDTLNIQATEILADGDFDGDKNPELLVLGNDGLHLLRGRDGAILWKKSGWTSSENRTNTQNTKLVDVNRDGKLDIIVKPHWISSGLVYAYSFRNGIRSNADENLIWSHSIQGTLKNGYFPVVADIDGDTQPEVFSAIGSAIDTCNATNGVDERYIALPTSMYGGRTEVVNLDSDPQLEVLLYSSLSDKSITLFDFSKQNSTFMAQALFSAGDALAAPYQAVVDLDKDGKPEILANRFDGTRWNALLYRYTEGSTSGTLTVLASLSNAYLLGAADLNGDGFPELLARNTVEGTRLLEPFATVTGYAFAEGALSAVWQLNRAAIPQVGERGTATLNTLATDGSLVTQDVNGDGALDLYLSVDEDRDNLADGLRIYSFKGGAPKMLQEQLYAEGYGLTLLRVGDGLSSPSAIDELAVLDTYGFLKILGPRLETRASLKVGGYFRRFAQVLDANQDGDAELVVANSANVLRSLDPFLLDQTGEIGLGDEYWAYSGLTTQYGLAADFYGDGNKEFVVRNARNSGSIRLELLDADGIVLESLALASNPYNFVVSNFVGDSTLDVFATRLGSDGQYYNFVVDGASWTVAWESKAVYPDTTTSPVEDLTAIPIDFNGDGRDDIFYGHQWYVCRMAGLTGVQGACSTRDTYLFGWGMAKGEVDGDAEPDVALFQPQYVSLMNLNSSLNYRLDRASGETSAWPSTSVVKDGALADADEDGKSELYVANRNTLYKFNPNGSTAWILRLENGVEISSVTSNRLGSVTVGDTDGDGALEVLVGATDGFLYCIDALTGDIEWVNEFYYQVGEPVLADTDGDGTLDIVVAVADGHVYVLTRATLGAVQNVRDAAVSPEGQILNPGADASQTEVIERLGATWDAVPGATGYMVAVLSDRNTYVVDWMDVGNTTQLVITDSRLVYGRSYRVLVQAYDRDRNGSPWSSSNGIEIIDVAPPTISDLVADPSPFNPDLTTTTIHAQLSDLTGLVSYKLEILSASGTLVYTRTEGTSSTSVTLALPWDGRNSSGIRLADGLYTLRMTTTDYGGHSVVLNGSVELVSDIPTPTPEPTPEPTATPLPPTPTPVPPTPTPLPPTPTPVEPTSTPGEPTSTPVEPTSTPVPPTPTPVPPTPTPVPPTATPEPSSPTPTVEVTPTELPGTATPEPVTPTATPGGVTPAPTTDPTGETPTPTDEDPASGCACTLESGSAAQGETHLGGLLVLLGAVGLLRRRRTAGRG